ncbi:uncharacterized protein LOC131676601 [Topomyia yanbarensis]|uniref:uncharacterized protein LOC131676601 n=1 Tax=Topomyia yanbarensis TaxID=2498891 RepID=UPI00273AA281|nr:uncharacterized protein LOC131676601 [Topomyia yanbarensis]
MKLIVLALLACGQLALSSPVGKSSSTAAGSLSEDTEVLIEFDRLFNKLHYDIDYKLRIYRMQHSVRLKNLNAQFISRYAFAITDIQHMKQHAKEEILEHALQIGDTQNPCIVAANDEAIRRATQAARDLSIVSEKIYGEMATVSRVMFYPIVDQIQVNSTFFQYAVLDKLGRDNALIHIQETLADLAFLYMQNADAVDRVVATLDHEVEAFQDVVNELRRGIWPQIDEIARSYIFNMEQLIEEALQCA